MRSRVPCWLVVLLALPVAGQDWRQTITVSSGESDIELVIGQHYLATFGLDRDLGEFEWPPLPPRPNFDVRFVGSDLGNGTSTVLIPASVGRTDTLSAAVQPMGDNPVVFRWDPDALASHTSVAVLQDAFNGALGVHVDMHRASEFVLSDERIDRLQLVIRAQSAGLELSTWAEVKASWE